MPLPLYGVFHTITRPPALFAGDGFVSRGARTLREARSGGYGVWVRTFFGICERGVAVAILCQPRGRARGTTGKVATDAYRQRS